jgi:DinB family protein
MKRRHRKNMPTGNDQSLRKHLLTLLQEGQAHANFEAAVKNMPGDLQGKRPDGGPHSPWELLEHMRIAQWDILEFIRNPKHVSPNFPDGYWPPQQTPPDIKAWGKSADSFRADLRDIVEIISQPSADLFAKLPHGDGQTILREALLVADHNAYHLGQLIIVRRLLGAWE